MIFRSALVAWAAALAVALLAALTFLGVQAVRSAKDAAVVKRQAAFDVNAAQASADALIDLQATLTKERTSNDAVRKELQAKLAESELRNARLGADLVRLHDTAAGPVSSGTPAGDSGGTRPTGEAASCADLLDTAVENYGIARSNAAQLDALIGWYHNLQSPAWNGSTGPYGVAHDE